MSGNFKRVLIAALGVIFLLAGIAGLALPFLQGFLFIFIGIVLLSIVSERFKKYVESHTRRFPHLHKFVEKAEALVDRYIGRP